MLIYQMPGNEYNTWCNQKNKQPIRSIGQILPIRFMEQNSDADVYHEGGSDNSLYHCCVFKLTRPYKVELIVLQYAVSVP